MKFVTKNRRWLAAILLAVYGSAGVLGYGLHALWDCDHCCDVADANGHCHEHADPCDHHGGQVLVSADECSICAFLAQAQSEQVAEQPLLVTTISSADPPTSDNSDLPVTIRLHLARGPPLA